MSRDSKLSENVKNMALTKGFAPEVDVSADMAYKDQYMNNSFFAIGHFAAKGHVIDYLYHMMSYVIPGSDAPIMTYCFSVTDETEKKYYQDSHVIPLSDMDAPTDRFALITKEGRMEGDIDSFKLAAAMEKGALDLTLEPVGYPLYNGGTGMFHMVGMDIYEYSLPACKTTGAITIDGETYEVDGISWYDRQWQNKLPAIPKAAIKPVNEIIKRLPKKGEMTLPVWGWMDINLENGDFVSAWFAQEKDGENCWATVMHPDGAQRCVKLEPVVSQAADHWISQNSGASYPMTYKIQCKELEMDLTVRTVVNDQELYFSEIALFNHYEGASTVEGIYQGQPMKGYCYVEMIGDGSKK